MAVGVAVAVPVAVAVAVGVATLDPVAVAVAVGDGVGEAGGGSGRLKRGSASRKWTADRGHGGLVDRPGAASHRRIGKHASGA